MRKIRLLPLIISPLLLTVSIAASAHDAPMEFQNVAAAKAWFGKAYPEFAVRKESVANGGQKVGDIYGFYGPRGSGFGRIEAWYYSCQPSYCGLLAMIKYRSLKSESEEPKLSLESNTLVIRYGRTGLLRLE